MKLIKNENVVGCDVDDTLVIWSKDHKKPGKGKMLFIDPYTKEKLYLTPHNPHIRLLKQYKGRGFAIVVHSAAGYMWVEEVVNRLKLDDIVDLGMAKFCKHMDDKVDVVDIIGARVYLKNDV